MIFLNKRYLIAVIVFIALCLLFVVLLIYSALFAYRKNAEKEPDDPEKKEFSPLAPWLAPATPLLWLGRRVLLAPWSILFGLFLILFPFILILFRPLSEDDPIMRFILKVGNGVLEINTRFLHTMGIEAKPMRFSA